MALPVALPEEELLPEDELPEEELLSSSSSSSRLLEDELDLPLFEELLFEFPVDQLPLFEELPELLLPEDELPD